MKYFKWKREFSLGNKIIDKQHKKLFKLMDSFSNSVVKKEDHQISLEKFDDVIDYMSFHFAFEEEIMDEQFACDCFSGQRLAHKHSHELFRDIIITLREVYADKEFSVNIIPVIRKWVTVYLVTGDVALVKALRENCK